MDFLAFVISIIAVLAPILLAAGILHLLLAASVGISGIALNLLAAVVGTLRFALNLPGPYSGLLTVLFVFFLVLALTADARFGRQLWKTLSVSPVPVRGKSPRPQPRPSARAPVSIRPYSKTDSGKKRIQILSPSTWVLHNDWGDIRVFTVPPAIIEKNKNLPASDRQFRITYDQDEEPIEDTFMISQNFQILLPTEILEKLQGSEFIRFEIGG